MRSSYNLSRLDTSFDDDNLVPNAGLVPCAVLAEKLGLAELVDKRVHLPIDAAGRANCGTNSIDDTNVLRAGAAGELFDQIRAPSTIGTWLRGFDWATVRQLDAVSRVMLARAWQAGLGPDLSSDLVVDIDSTICETYGVSKQGARFGYTGVRGYHPLVSSLAGTGKILHCRMRGGNAGSARGAGTFVRETISRIRNAGAQGGLTMRADTAFYGRPFINACRDHDVRFSVTAGLSSCLCK